MLLKATPRVHLGLGLACWREDSVPWLWQPSSWPESWARPSEHGTGPERALVSAAHHPPHQWSWVFIERKPWNQHLYTCVKTHTHMLTTAMQVRHAVACSAGVTMHPVSWGLAQPRCGRRGRVYTVTGPQGRAGQGSAGSQGRGTEHSTIQHFSRLGADLKSHSTFSPACSF